MDENPLDENRLDENWAHVTWDKSVVGVTFVFVSAGRAKVIDFTPVVRVKWPNVVVPTIRKVKRMREFNCFYPRRILLL